MIPDIVKDSDWPLRCRRGELALARVGAVVIPLVAFAAVPFLRSVAVVLITLRPPERWVHPDGWAAPLSLAAAAAVSMLAVAWWLMVRRDVRHGLSTALAWPVAATLAVVVFLAFNVVAVHPKVLWTGLEATKVRADRYSYVSSVASWQSRWLYYRGAPAADRLVAIGSSQVNFAVQPDLLQELCPEYPVEKWAMPGFNPMQYCSAGRALLTPAPAAVVCWLSEFDFFREDSLPANRLRPFVNPSDVPHLASDLGLRLVMDNRAELADLAVAASLPLWRYRDMVRTTLMDLWWAAPALAMSSDGDRAAQRIDSAEGMRNLARSIGRMKMVEANFASFARFAREVQACGSRLIVVEGCSHPDAMALYDPGFRAETAQRLVDLARSVPFEYVPSQNLPAFTADDFVDPYHLSEEAARRFTRALALIVNEGTATAPGRPGGAWRGLRPQHEGIAVCASVVCRSVAVDGDL